jgi:hypothetical protein
MMRDASAVRRTIFSVLGATLLAASLMQQTAVAAGNHRATRADRALVSASQRFRNASNPVAVPSLAEQDLEYWRARGLSAGGPSALRW